MLDSLAKYQSLLDDGPSKESGDYYRRQRQRVANTNGGDGEDGSELTDDIEIDSNELPSSGRHLTKSVTQREIQRLIASDSIDSMEVSKDNQLYLYNLLVGLYEGS